jgi:hypothetical protein
MVKPMAESDQQAAHSRGQQSDKQSVLNRLPVVEDAGAEDGTTFDRVDEAGEESFPASDPPAWTMAGVASREGSGRLPFPLCLPKE